MQFTPTQIRAATWTLIALVAAWLLWWLGPVLTPFIVGAILAYALTPLVDRLVNRLHVPRVLAVVGVEVIFIVVVLALALLVVPILVKQLPLLREQLPLLLDRFNDRAQPLLAQWGINAQLDLASLKTFVRDHLSANFEDSLGPVMASVKLGGSVALSVVGNAVLIPVVLFYLLLDWASVVRLLLGLVPPRLRQGVDSFLAEADAVLGQYLRGQLLVMGVLALYYVVGLALFGLKLALPIGVFTGLAIAIPYLGFGFGLVLALLAGSLEFAATGGVMQALLMVGVVYGIGQVVESFYLTPKLVGKRIGLHPLAVIFALLAFGHALGFIGVLIALPSSAVLYVALRRATRTYKASRLYGG
ncbi:MAG: AI-2E family transporter [Comamonadaceae bacterium CG1_02_60_18]|nr:MAG: AI-2E family transporter [Comamonadaceae bacterium CG1_02_60_18]PIQ52777.1 MAG: AI-2E family transporter [Comamonadaceae bacterium CG12_big_fil_rev_8_21_14_0_65_59_15]